MPIGSRLCLMIALGLAAGPGDGRAQALKPPPIAPEAKARLDALIASYRGLPAYADHGEVTLVVKVGERVLRQVQRASITFARPDKLDVRTDLVRVVSDGSTITSTVAPLKKYSVVPAPKKFTESSLRSGPLGSIEFGGLAGLPLVHALSLVVGDDPKRLIEDFSPKVLAEPDVEVNGQAYRVLRLDESDNHDWRYLIDPKTGLLAFIDLVVEGDALKSSIAGDSTRVESLRWAAGAISTDPPSPEAFVFRPEAGYTKIGMPEAAPAPGAAGAEPPDSPLVGKPAPDFTLEVLDGPDKLRRVAKAELLGKVVVLDFWATWCGPCLVELPDIQKLREAYEKAGKNVVVVALSIDQAEAGDLKAARVKVEAKLKEQELTLASVGGGLVALDPLGKLAERFGVQAIPFVVVIDPQGVVRAVHVGVTSRDVLAAEVDALLAGQPIGGGR